MLLPAQLVLPAARARAWVLVPLLPNLTRPWRARLHVQPVLLVAAQLQQALRVLQLPVPVPVQMQVAQAPLGLVLGRMQEPLAPATPPGLLPQLAPALVVLWKLVVLLLAAQPALAAPLQTGQEALLLLAQALLPVQALPAQRKLLRPPLLVQALQP